MSENNISGCLDVVNNTLNFFFKNAVSGPEVAQWWPTSYILQSIANDGPLKGLAIWEVTVCSSLVTRLYSFFYVLSKCKMFHLTYQLFSFKEK